MNTKSINKCLWFALISLSHFANAQTFEWAVSIGGSDFDRGHAIAVDAIGNVYTTGYFRGTVDFDPGIGVYNLSAAGLSDIFISKLDASSNFIWAISLGSTNHNNGVAIATDMDGNVYITGEFYGTIDFDPGAATYALSSVGLSDIFVLKLDGAGNFIWAKRFGGPDFDNVLSIALDHSGNVYTTGYFYDIVDFDPGPGVFNISPDGPGDAFISKLDAAGNFVWAKSIGGASPAAGRSITTDGNGNVYTTGIFYGTADFDPGAGTFNLSSQGSSDIFISKLDAAGNFIWAKSIGGIDDDWSNDITTDAFGNVLITGRFSGTVDFDSGTGVFELISEGISDIFIAKVDASGNFLWAKQMGGSSADAGHSITTDPYGNVYSTGVFYFTVDFDPGPGTFNLTSAGSADIYISKLDESGNFIWAKSMGGSLDDFSASIAIDTTGCIYTAGYFSGTADFDPDAGIFNLTSAGIDDVFVHKMNQTQLGLHEDTTHTRIRVYPNPTYGKLAIISENQFSNVQLTVRNVLGKEVFHKNYASGYLIELTLEGAPGVYFIEIIDGNKRARLKVIKE